jgi:protein SON
LKFSDSIFFLILLQCLQIPVRKPEERVTAQAQLKQQFPVSSGQQHLELEWVPVSPKPTETTSKAKKSVPASEGTKPVIRQPVVPAAPDSTTIDIGEVVSRRLAAIRKLQENKEDDQARTELEQAEMMSKSWASQIPQQRTNPITGEPLPELVDWSGAPQVITYV